MESCPEPEGPPEKWRSLSGRCGFGTTGIKGKEETEDERPCIDGILRRLWGGVCTGDINACCDELEETYLSCRQDPGFLKEFYYYLQVYAGRPTPSTGRSAFPKNSGWNSTRNGRTSTIPGAHKINNTLGQILLARRMGKKRIVAETGAGQHGRGHRHHRRPVRAGMRGLHGGGRHPPPSVECFSPHEAPGRGRSGRYGPAAGP